MSFGPLLTARKASVLRAIRVKPPARSAMPVVARRHSDEKITCEAMRNSGSSSLVGRSPSSTTGILRRRAASQIGCTKCRVPVVGQHGVSRRDRGVGIGRRRGGDALVAIGHDGAVAARIHEDRRQRRRQARDALTKTAIDVLARKCRQHAVAVGVLAGRAAHRPGQRHAAAEPRDRDGGIRGAAAVDDKKSRRLHLAVGLRKFRDAKHLIQHDDAGAKNARRAGFSAGHRCRARHSRE